MVQLRVSACAGREFLLLPFAEGRAIVGPLAGGVT